jgi:hypothetical protein
LHWAAANNSSAAVIVELLRAYPEADTAREKDQDGDLPLHLALRNHSNAAFTVELLKAYPEAAREKDEYGNLPLHLAGNENSDAAFIVELVVTESKNSNAAVISELLKAYPEAAREKNEIGIWKFAIAGHVGSA